MNNIGNYISHARFWDWGGIDRSCEFEYWLKYAQSYGCNVLMPMCALAEAGAYLAERGLAVTAFDITPDMVDEGKKRFGETPGLLILEGNICDFHFDISPADFCYCTDFGHLHSTEDIQKALLCINKHLRPGGGLVIETSIRHPRKKSSHTTPQTFHPQKQIYPDLKVWKTSENRYDAEAGRQYISQTFYAEDTNGKIDTFDHEFYMQEYFRIDWLEALKKCGFEIKNEYSDRDKSLWRDTDMFWIVEAIANDFRNRD